MPSSGWLRHTAVLAILTASTLALPERPAAASPQEKRSCFAAYERVQVAMRRSRLLEAREAASACLADTCPSALRADCGQWLKDVEARLPSIVVECRTADGKPVTDARLSLDGAPWKARPDGIVSEVDPGEHVVRAERPNAPPAELRVVVAEGKKAQRIVVELPADAAAAPVATSPPPPPPPPPEVTTTRAPPPISAFILAGVSAVALGGFTFFAFTGKNAEHGLDACSPRCSDEAVSPVRQRYIAADVFLGVSVVALGFAAYAFLSRGYVDRPSADARPR